MALTLFGSSGAQDAAAANRALLNTYGAATNDIYNQYGTGATGAIQTGTQQGVGALGTGLTNQLAAYGDVTTSPLQSAIDAYQSGVGAAGTGTNIALDAGRAGVAAYDPLAALGASYQPAIDQYYAALGLKGPQAGAQVASDFFANYPGYAQLEQMATDQLLNNASRTGGALSGNTLDALQQRQMALSTPIWQDYLNRLQGFVSPQLAAISGAASGRAGANATLGQLGLGTSDALTRAYGALAGGYGNLFSGSRALAGDISGLYGTNASQLASLYGTQGSDIANILGNVATGQQQTARDVVQGNIAANNQVAQASAQDAANLWGLLGAGVKAAGSIYGGRGA
jgi:hypothetical protein